MILLLSLTILIGLVGAIVYLIIQIGQKPCQKDLLMSVLGSGGHTHEMLTLVKSLVDDEMLNDNNDYQFPCNSIMKSVVFIVSEGDQFSQDKLNQTFPEWKTECNNQRFSLFQITRSRQVHQSYITSIWTTLLSLLDSWRILQTIRPAVLLCNGPGVCIPIVLITKLLSPQTNIVFVESFCRTRSLSLSGKIVYHGRLAHHFMVQWPKLQHRYPRAKFIGLLV